MLRSAQVTVAIALLGLAGCSSTIESAATPSATMPDRDRAALAARPPSDEDARKAVVERFQRGLGDSARFAHGPLVNSVVVTSGGTKLAGWFMCGTIDAKDGAGTYSGPRTYMAEFDPVRGNDVLGSFMDRGDGEVVAGWCQQVHRNDLALAGNAPSSIAAATAIPPNVNGTPAPANPNGTPVPRLSVVSAAPFGTCNAGYILCSLGQAFRTIAEAIGLGPTEAERMPASAERSR
jgi:hypothetical protein